MERFKQHIIDLLVKETRQENIKQENINLEIPPNPEMGDYAFPCFALAGIYKKSPDKIAAELASRIGKKIGKTKLVEKVIASGPYLNFFLNKTKLVESTIKEILDKKQKYGSSNLGKGKKIILEHTSINPNASPHVGRARNALIGDAIKKILLFQNYKVETHFFVNDVGKQIALLVLGAEGKKNISFDGLLDLYVEINKKLEKAPELEKEVLSLLNQLEKGDKKVRQKFKKIVDTCVKGQTDLFSELGINYDKFDYESEYLWSRKTIATLRFLEKTGKLFVDGYNRWVLDQKGYGLGVKVPVLVLTRGDGTSLYPLRDIAYAIELANKGTYVVILGEDQKLYNEQINAALKELEMFQRNAVYYSFVLLKEEKTHEKMSTRKGNVVLLSEFMKEAEEKAGKEIEKRHGKSNVESAKVIGYGAVKFGILRVSPEKSVIFDWGSALSFEGESAPYIQYAYARIMSILKKQNKLQKSAPSKKVRFFADKLATKEDFELIKLLSDFPETINKAAKELRPHLIANYTYRLAQKFNEYYHIHPVLKAEQPVREARIMLIKSVARVIENSLGLLGIDVLNKM